MDELTQMIRAVADRQHYVEHAEAACREADRIRSEAVQSLADAETALAERINAVLANAYRDGIPSVDD